MFRHHCHHVRSRQKGQFGYVEVPAHAGSVECLAFLLQKGTPYADTCAAAATAASLKYAHEQGAPA